jgi:hypothetical protein
MCTSGTARNSGGRHRGSSRMTPGCRPACRGPTSSRGAADETLNACGGHIGCCRACDGRGAAGSSVGCPATPCGWPASAPTRGSMSPSRPPGWTAPGLGPHPSRAAPVALHRRSACGRGRSGDCMERTVSARGWRKTARTWRRHSGSSSRKRTPWWASDTSAGIGTWPPLSSPASERGWWGARHGRVVTTAVRALARPATQWRHVVLRASASVIAGTLSNPIVSGRDW